MATGPEHYREAERLLAAARESKATTYEGDNPEADRDIAEAQAHATLALTAAMAMPGAYFGDEGVRRDQRAWSDAIRPAAVPAQGDDD